MKKLAALALSLFLVTGTALADSSKDTPKNTDAQPAKTATTTKPATEKTNAEIAAQMEELRQALQAQQEQLQMLKEEIAKRDRQIEEAREAAAAANAKASDASVKATEAVATTAEVKSTTAALNTTVTNMEAVNAATVNTAAQAAAAQGNAANTEEGPLTIRYKGVGITPGGFLAAETVNRQRAISADIPTPFTSIPYPGNALSKVTEFNGTGRQSRLTLLVDAKIGAAKVNGYYEADFLGAGTTSNNRQTNSYVFRQRQLYGLVALENGWTFSGGQMWSLATTNRKGIANRVENLPMMIDPNYVVGLTWDRAYAFRVTKNFGDKFAIAAAVEGPQTTIGGRGFSSYTTQAISATGAITVPAATANFWFDAPGNGGGLFNPNDATGYTANRAPDLVFKAAADPGFGHYEVFGIVGFFRDRIYPCAVVSIPASNAAGTQILSGPAINPIGCVGATGAPLTTPSSFLAYNNTSTGGGFGASALLPVIAKKLDFTISGTWGDGIGRFGAAQLADATARPNGTLALLRGEQALARLEWHATPKWDVYAYFGNEYAWRAGYTGYNLVTVSNTPAIPGCSPTTTLCPGAPLATQPAYPSVQTYATKINQIGGYGNKAANNTGCSAETAPPATGPAGSGYPSAGGTCAGDIRNIIEGTLGFWFKPYAGPKGRIQMGLQYSYLEKWGWSGTGGLPAGSAGISPKAVNNEFYTSFRYYLP